MTHKQAAKYQRHGKQPRGPSTCWLLQVRNLASCVKVAVDFVLPESLDQAFKFAEEFRFMAKDEAWEPVSGGELEFVQPSDRLHTDKLQAELSMCLAAKHAVEAVLGTATAGAYVQDCTHTYVAVSNWWRASNR